MMNEKKNIDKIFKERFKDFEAVPNDAVWKQIEQKLHKDKRKRRVVPIWWKVGGVAATLALLLTVANVVFNDVSVNDSVTTNTVVDTEKTSTINSSEGFSAEENNMNNSRSGNKNDSKSAASLKKDQQNNVAETDAKSENYEAEPNPSESANEKNPFTTRDIISKKNQTVLDSESSEKSSGSSKNNSAVAENKKKNIEQNQSQNKDNRTGLGVAKNEEGLPKIKNIQNIKTGKASNDAIAQTKNLSNSQSNKNSENALIDSSKVDALISKSIRNSDAAVTDTKTAPQDELLIETDSLQIQQDTNTIEKAIAAINDKDDIEKEEEEKLNRWSVSPNVAPVYFNSLGKNGSSIDNQFTDNAKQGEVNMSYGVAGSYAFNKKLKIRAGVNRVDLGYRTNNIFVFDGADASIAPTASANSNRQQLDNVALRGNYNTNAFMSASAISFATAPDILFTREQTSLDQSLGFIEVPIELEYNLLDKKFGVNVIGGFSTLFLNNNEVFAVQDGNSTLLGEATNVNDMSYSANFGLGLNYNFSKQFRFNLEPTFKYQINTFDNTSGDFNPYFIGLYTGFSFKF